MQLSPLKKTYGYKIKIQLKLCFHYKDLVNGNCDCECALLSTEEVSPSTKKILLDLGKSSDQ